MRARQGPWGLMRGEVHRYYMHAVSWDAASCAPLGCAPRAPAGGGSAARGPESVCFMR